MSDPKLLVVKDILVVLMSLQPALATEAIVWPLRCTQLVALSVTTRGLLHQKEVEMGRFQEPILNLKKKYFVFSTS